MLIFAFLGVVLCLASVMLFGVDLSHYINNVSAEGLSKTGAFKFTKILDVMHDWTPDTWMSAVNYLNDGPLSIQKSFAEFSVNIPASIVGLLLGAGLVMIGFRIRRYRQG